MQTVIFNDNNRVSFVITRWQIDPIIQINFNGRDRVGPTCLVDWSTQQNDPPLMGPAMSSKKNKISFQIPKVPLTEEANAV